MSSVEFAARNGLDGKCLEVLQSHHPDVQRFVIARGAVEGRNPSAMVMGRIANAMSQLGIVSAPPAGVPLQSNRGQLAFAPRAPLVQRPSMADKVCEQVEVFIEQNELDEKCAESLRAQSADCQMAVISQGNADGRNKSAMVTGRIKKFGLGGKGLR